MPLMNYVPKTETINLPGGESFNVRAISLSDVSILVDVHEFSITLIADKIRSRQEMFSGDEEMVHTATVDIITELVREAPVLVGNLIAICADERNAMEQAAKLPITVQIEAMTKIAGLTFTDLASIKKLSADVMRLVRGIVPTAKARRPK